jgi:hypothetical protein
MHFAWDAAAQLCESAHTTGRIIVYYGAVQRYCPAVTEPPQIVRLEHQ